MMRCSLILLATIAGAGVAATHAVAQQQAYETPKYSTDGGSTLDKNYGMLPTPNADQMPQRTMAPENRVPPQPDFFGKRPSLDWPEIKSDTSSTTAMETPLFTTPETTPNADMTTGGFTTGGFTTGDINSSTGGFGSQPLKGANRSVGR